MLERFFADDTSGGFSLYDGGHISWLVGIIALCVVLSIVYKRMSEKGRYSMGLVFGISIVALEIMKDIVLAAQGRFELGHLPLHLCGLSIFVEFINSIRPNKFTQELMYSVCMPGALMALIFPNWTARPMFTFLNIHSFLIHALLVIYPVVIVASGAFRPCARRLGWCFAAVFGVSIPIFILNKFIDTNFMFLNWPSEGSPLVWFETLWGNPGYIAGIFIILAVLWVVMYAPFVIADMIKAKRAES